MQLHCGCGGSCVQVSPVQATVQLRGSSVAVKIPLPRLSPVQATVQLCGQLEEAPPTLQPPQPPLPTSLWHQFGPVVLSSVLGSVLCNCLKPGLLMASNMAALAWQERSGQELAVLYTSNT